MRVKKKYKDRNGGKERKQKEDKKRGRKGGKLEIRKDEREGRTRILE